MMILVTGATGNVGREVVKLLQEDGQRVRAMSRNPKKAGFPAGVEAAAGDFSDPQTWDAVLDGVECLYLIHAQGSGNFVQAAREAGVKKIVFLSSGAIDAPIQNAIGQNHLQTENVIRRSGMKWTFLRPGAFMSNALQWADGVRREGVVRAPFGDIGSVPIDPRDIAAVAAKALVHPEHDGQIYPMSGPEVLTLIEQVNILGGVLGTEIRYESVPEAAASEHMKRFMPPEIVDALFDLMRGQSERSAEILDTVEKIAGRPPRTFKMWAADHADLFR